MQLKDKKYIKNTRRFPKYYGGRTAFSDLYGNDYSVDPTQYTTNNQQNPQSGNNQQGSQNPKGAVGSGGLGPWGSIAEIAATNVKGFINELNYQPTKADQIESNQGSRYQSYGGIQYKQIDNDIDVNSYRQHWSTQNKLNNFFSGNVGGVLGIDFGGGDQKQLDEIKKAINNINVKNRAARADAFSQYWQNRNQFESAYDGRDANTPTRSTGNKKLVNTAYGKQYLPQNAWVSKNERIIDTETGAQHFVKFGKNDTAPAHLTGKDAVLSASKKKSLLNPETGNSFSEDYPTYAAAGRVQDLLDLQKYVHMVNGNVRNKTPKYYGGRTAFSDLYGNDYSVDPTQYINNLSKTTKPQNLDDDLKRVDKGRIPEIKPWEILLSRLPGLFSSIGGFINTRKQPTSRINSYHPNTYAKAALPKLAGLRINAMPILKDIDDKYRTYLSYLNSQPSLTAGQRQLYQLAAMRNSQEAKAKAMYDNQVQNNAYLTNWANAAIGVGKDEASSLSYSDRKVATTDIRFIRF